jgi:predicted dithiol-disulfide oxidoreductase (DUF899 family)
MANGYLDARDASLVAVSRAPYAQLAAYEKRMGWSFKWLSSHGSDFNYDFRVSFTPEELAAKRADYNFKLQDPHAPEREGVSVFYRDAAGKVFRTYSAYARGRDEGTRTQYWVRRHDEYAR